MDEADFIGRISALATHAGARGLADDAAVLEVGGETLVLTCDMVVEGVHTLPGADPADTAWKLVAVNLSDLAAKGAEPLGVLLGHMLGDEDERFVEGLRDALEHFGVPLLGGDTTGGGPPRAWSLTAVGRAMHTPVPSRAGARPGDGLYVTGPLGAAMLGYEALRDGTGEDSTAYRRPMARLPQGMALAPHVTAMMDISDGLLLDSWRMASASKATFAIQSVAVPIATPRARQADAMRWGEDFELLFTAPATTALLPVKAWRIGAVKPAGNTPLLLDGEALTGPEGLGYQHRRG
jgi:thiamine-monophosphate kinase